MTGEWWQPVVGTTLAERRQRREEWRLERRRLAAAGLLPSKSEWEIFGDTGLTWQEQRAAWLALQWEVEAAADRACRLAGRTPWRRPPIRAKDFEPAKRAWEQERRAGARPCLPRKQLPAGRRVAQEQLQELESVSVESRWILLREAWKHGEGRQRCCRALRLPQQQLVLSVRGEEVTPRAGLAVCGRWSCPACSALQGSELAESIAAAHRLWFQEREGASCFLITLTVAHNGEPASAVARLVSDWRALSKSRVWREVRRRYGLSHVLRGLDWSVTRSGLHPHLHVLCFGEISFADTGAFHLNPADWRAVELANFRDAVEEAWPTVGPRAVDVREWIEGAEYAVAGWSAGAEVAAAHLKRRHPLRLLALGSKWAADLWRDWAEAQRGQRVLTGHSRLFADLGADAIAAERERARKERAKHAQPREEPQEVRIDGPAADYLCGVAWRYGWATPAVYQAWRWLRSVDRSWRWLQSDRSEEDSS